jgi:hypothetical protein
MINNQKLNALRATNSGVRAVDEQSDLRSVRSEFDYKEKKNFTDVLGEPSKNQQMERLRGEHDKDAKNPGDFSYKSSTYKSKASSKSNAKVAEKVE